MEEAKVAELTKKVMSFVDETHVEFVTGDLIGKVLAYITLIPIFLVVSFATHILGLYYSQGPSSYHLTVEPDLNLF